MEKSCQVNTVIIEDEQPAAEQLAKALSMLTPNVKMIARLGSVKESIAYLPLHPEIDLIFSDVQLSDGLCFDIFRQCDIAVPVIFITGYDEFILRAFGSNGIDYLLKPVESSRLQQAVQKYDQLRHHFNSTGKIRHLMEFIRLHSVKRILVKKGMQTIALPVEDIVLFYTEGGNVFAIDRFSESYLTEKNLTELETLLDPGKFFRANRKYLVHLDYIRGYISYERVKLKVHLTVPAIRHSVIVSQESAPMFRQWLHRP